MNEQAGRGSPARQLRGAYVAGARATIAALTMSASLAVLKIGAGIVGDSYALVADGIESVLDLFSGLLVLGGLKVSTAEPDARYPYGRGKAEPLVAMAVATMLMLAALGIAVGAAREIVSPQDAPAPFTLIVLLVVLVAKEGTFRWLSSRGRAIGSRAIEVDAWHHRSDALTSLAAFIGISLSLIGGPAWVRADDWAALAACGVIGWNGVRLFRGGVREALDVSAPVEIRERVRSVALAVDAVEGVDEVRGRRSVLMHLVDIHVEVDGSVPVSHGHEIGHRVKDALLESEVPILDVLVHVEPAPSVDREAQPDPVASSEATAPTRGG
jgi:cation diffusion facilitator family transporter